MLLLLIIREEIGIKYMDKKKGIKMQKKILLLMAALALLPSCAHSTIDTQSLDNQIETQRKNQGLVGLSVILAHKGNVLYSKGFGLANIAENKPVTSQTMFQIASVSKTFTYLALAKLFDMGIIKSIDDPINNYLDFPVINPKFPNTPITIRMLFAHQGSISDKLYNDIDEAELYRYNQDQPAGAFEQFIKDYFSQNGKYFKRGSIFSDAKPGTQEEYSNTNTALAGYIVEYLAKQNNLAASFNGFSKKFIFDPLGMTSTFWFLSEVDAAGKRDLLAMPYERGSNKAIGNWNVPDYPDGGAITTPTDYSKVQALIDLKGTVNGVQILKPSTVELITTRVYPGSDFGLGFHYHKEIKGLELFGHEGGERGVSTTAMKNLKNDLEVVVFTNTDDESAKGSRKHDIDDVALDFFVELLMKAGEKEISGTPVGAAMVQPANVQPAAKTYQGTVQLQPAAAAKKSAVEEHEEE